MSEQGDVTVTVSGTKIQKVGFRAMIQKMAIAYNLAGSARNNRDGTVDVSFQGAKARIDEIVAAMRAGSKKSSRNNTISPAPTAGTDDRTTFTVFAWTSTSRDITTPYDLVFELRAAGNEISHQEAKTIWNEIAINTLHGEDREKFLRHLDSDD